MFSKCEHCNLALMHEMESEMDFHDASQLKLRRSGV